MHFRAIRVPRQRVNLTPLKNPAPLYIGILLSRDFSRSVHIATGLNRIEFAPMRDPRFTKLADVLVNYSVGVKKGQLVRISGPPCSQPLVIELYTKVLEAGGRPMVRMVREELNEIFLKQATEDQLRFCSPINLYEYETLDASIGIWAEENTKALTNCDPKKIGVTQAARKPLMDTFMKRA